MKRKTSFLLVLSAVMLLCAMIAGCGGGGEGGTETGTEPASESAVVTGPESEPGTEPYTEEPGTEPSVTEPVTVPETEPVTEPETEPRVTVADVRPRPMEMSAAPGESVPFVSCAAVTPGAGAEGYAGALASLSIPTGADGLPLTVEITDLSGRFDTCPDEGYILEITADGVRVTAGSDRGAFYALVTLGQLMDGGRLPLVRVSDAPVLPIRGVIEGFYGVAWTHEFRLELFAFMGREKMNTYMYAPKDDPKHRAGWRQAYTGKELERMRELIDTAAENRVKFVYAISPGLDFNLGDGYDRDFDKLTAKCESMYELGVRDFAILLDDIPTLNAEGHARLLNDFQTRFCAAHEGVSPLIAITPEFCGDMLTSYSDALAPLLDPAIEMMWTGQGVIPPAITSASMKDVTSLYGRRMLIWWNYPVNDGQPDELFMDAARGLSSDLDGSVTGLLANPMNQGHASFVPLFTTADYLWAPARYSADDALKAAVRALYPDVADEIADFIDLTCASTMNGRVDSVELAKLVTRFKNKPDAENARRLGEALSVLYEEMLTIREKGDPALVSEIKPWLDKAAAFCGMGRAYCEMELEAAGENRTDVLLTLLDDYLTADESVRGSTASVSTCALAPWIQGLPTRIHELLGFEVSSAAGITTNLPTYQDYGILNAVDGRGDTWFWSNGAPTASSWIMLNLGSVRQISAIRLQSGVGGHTDDWMHEAELQYSTDRTHWESLGRVSSRTIDMKVDIRAQYIRLLCRASQQYWVTVSDFSAVTADEDADVVTTDAEGVTPMALLSVTDGSLFTGLSLTPESASGHTLTVRTAGAASVTVIMTHLPENSGMTAAWLSADGTVLGTCDAAREMTIDLNGADRLVLTFGGEPVTIGEIMIK